MKEVYEDVTLARAVQDVARIKKLWRDDFGWRNKRDNYWSAAKFAAKRRKEEEYLRIDADRLTRKVERLYERLTEAGIHEFKLLQIFQIRRTA